MTSLQRMLSGLVYLVALLAVLSVFPYLGLWLQLFLAAAFVLGILQDTLRTRQVPGAMITLVSLGLCLLLVRQLSLANVVEPLVHILCVLLGARLLGTKTPRNILQLFALATIILAASSLLSLDMLYLVYLVMMILLLSSGLILLPFQVDAADATLTPAQRTGLRRFLLLIPGGSLVLMVGLFLVLPRTPVPLWNVTGQQGMATIGMTDQVRPGSFSDLAASGEVAFRAEMARIDPSRLYWRGVVMAELQGSVWRRGQTRAGADVVADSGDELIPYTLYAQAKTDAYLVTLERTTSLTGVAHRAFADGVFMQRSRSRKPLSYQGRGQLAPRISHEGDISAYLDLTAAALHDPRLHEVAAAIAADAATRSARIAAVETLFRQQQLSYSDRDLPLTDTPFATFLFDEKRGYCEHFASTFAVLLRLLDVPVRLVGGYYGGDYNPFGNFYLIGEDQAHVWVEAQDDLGYWRRIDPSRLAVNAEQTLLSRAGRQPALQHLADALFHYWTRHVLNFDLRQQFALMRGTTGLAQSLADGFRHYWYVPTTALLFLTAAVVLARRQSIRQRLVTAYLRRVARCAGCRELPPALGLYRLAQLSGEPLCRQFAAIYGASLYSDKDLTPDQIRQLRRIIRQLKGKSLSLAHEGCIPPIPRR